MSTDHYRQLVELFAQNPALIAIALWIVRIVTRQHREALTELIKLRTTIVKVETDLAHHTAYEQEIHRYLATLATGNPPAAPYPAAQPPTNP